MGVLRTVAFKNFSIPIYFKVLHFILVKRNLKHLYGVINNEFRICQQTEMETAIILSD